MVATEKERVKKEIVLITLSHVYHAQPSHSVAERKAVIVREQAQGA